MITRSPNKRNGTIVRDYEIVTDKGENQIGALKRVGATI
jgi:hypothetical protein